MAAAPSLELFLFTDEPLHDLTSDHLSLRPFSSMVAAAALSNRGPLNIGVFSGWGQGKTSVLRQAKALIEDQKKPNVITAWVNAWQYEHEAHPVVPLLAIIINEITKSIDSRKTVGEKEDDSITKTFADLKRALRSIAYGFSAKAGAKIPGFANLEVGFVAKDMIDRDEKLSSDRDPLLDQSLYYHAYERLEKFRTQLVESTPEDQPKIVVFIDDLDRCLPAKALHLLESLKLVLAQPGFIFVLGVDRHVIDSFLTKRYHRDFGIRAEKGHGRQYMDKIIQLPLDLPHHQSRFEKYIGNLILDNKIEERLPPAFRNLFNNTETGKAFIAALAAGCERTPRTLIRTLNYLLTDLFLRQHKFHQQTNDPFGNNDAEFLQFAAVSRITRITLGSDKERLYRKLLTNNWACKQIALSLKGERSIWDEDINNSESSYNYPSGAGQYQRDVDSVSPYRLAIFDSDCLKELFCTDLGQAWLNEGEKRQAIEGFLSIREEPSFAPVESSERVINALIGENFDIPAETVTEEHRKEITEINLSNSEINDLRPLSKLSNLEDLNLSGTSIIDLSPLQHLDKLRWLELRHVNISDLGPLENLNKLQVLDLYQTKVENITPIQKLNNLQLLNLNATQVKDLQPLQNLHNLTFLRLSGTPVDDLLPLRNLTNIELLNINGTKITDITLLQHLKSLKILDAGSTWVDDFSPLQYLRGLERLFLNGTRFSDLSPLRGLTNLKRLFLESTPVSDLNPLRELTSLQVLSLTNTQVWDLSPLHGLKNLELLYIQNTPAAKDLFQITALRTALPKIKTVIRSKRSS